MQSRCYKKSHKIHWKIPVLKSFFDKAAGLRLAILLKRRFSTGALLGIFKNFLVHFFYRTPLDDCLSNTVQITLH